MEVSIPFLAHLIDFLRKEFASVVASFCQSRTKEVPDHVLCRKPWPLWSDQFGLDLLPLLNNFIVCLFISDPLIIQGAEEIAEALKQNQSLANLDLVRQYFIVLACLLF